MNKYVLFIFLIWIQLRVEAQKITLQFSSTPTSTPSVSVAKLRYDKTFAYSYTFDDATDDAYKVALPLFKGGTIAAINQQSTGFFFTDGCGNDIPFRAGIAWNSTNSLDEDVHLNGIGGTLTWTQLDSLYRADWDVLNHSYAHRAQWAGAMTDADYDYQINQNRTVVRQKTQKAIEMPLFVVPSGDYVYQDRALAAGHKAVFDQNFPFGGISFSGITVDNVPDMTNFKMLRWDLQQIIAGTLTTKVNDIAVETQNGTTAKWWTEFSHRVDDYTTTTPFNFYSFKDYMTALAQKYGKDGSDKMWFAPLQTVFEYLQMRQNARFTSQLISGNRLDIDFDLSSVPTWLRRRTLTLVVNSNADFSQINIPSGTGIAVTFRGTGNRKIVNIDFTNYVAAIVPVELLDFSGKQAENGSVQLNWRTASEVNLKQFDIEKSSNGKDFKSIGSVKSKGQIQIENYVFNDINFKDRAYYRLKQIDNDGTFEYSKIITIAASSSRPNIKVTPSVSDDIWTVESDSDDLRRAQIEVFDANGKLIQSQKGTEKFIKTHQLPRGLYFIKVTIGQQFWVRKMVKI
jgi:hypothetical protein